MQKAMNRLEDDAGRCSLRIQSHLSAGSIVILRLRKYFELHLSEKVLCDYP